eukprot:s121_g46.t1
MAEHRSLGKPDDSEAVQGWNAVGWWISGHTGLPQRRPEVHSESLSHDGILGERMHMLVLSLWWNYVRLTWCGKVRTLMTVYGHPMFNFHKNVGRTKSETRDKFFL